MVKSEIDDVTTYYPSAAYQVKTNGSYANTRKYYSFNGAAVAMRENSTLTWLLHTCPPEGHWDDVAGGARETR
jgi:hypothetical protein